VKLSLITSPSSGGGEVQRQRELRDQSRRTRRAQFWADARCALIDGVRAVFILLLGATIVVFIVSNQTEISSVVRQKISRVESRLKSPANPDPLRQSALNHEKEVEDAAK
jgi:hypothetical protein